MPIVTAYPIDLTNDPQPITTGGGGEFNGPYKAANGALYCWATVNIPSAGNSTFWVYKSTDGGHGWTPQDTAAAPWPTSVTGPAAVSTDGSRLTVGQLESTIGNFLIDFSFVTDRWLFGEGLGSTGTGYGVVPDTPISSSSSGAISALEMRYLSNGNVRLVYARNSNHNDFSSPFRMYYAEYSFGSASWITTDASISNENTLDVRTTPTCSAIDGSDNIALFHKNSNGDYYYNSIAAGGTVSVAVDVTSSSPALSTFWNCQIDTGKVKLIVYMGSSFGLPSIVQGSSIISPTWSSYLLDSDPNDDAPIGGFVWRDAAGALRESWSDYGDNGSLASHHYFAEVIDGSTAPAYYDLTGFPTASYHTSYTKQFSISKEGYLVYVAHNLRGDGHLYFIPPAVVKRRNYSYVGILGSNLKP